jgi:hypothetical protein
MNQGGYIELQAQQKQNQNQTKQVKALTMASIFTPSKLKALTMH